jgi:hypothetical protein
VTVPVDEAPPRTLAGASVTDTSFGASSVSVAVLLTPPRVPVIVAVVSVAIATVVTVNGFDSVAPTGW